MPNARTVHRWIAFRGHSIGGLDLGLERAGMEVRWQVEIDEFCRRVLAKHWPDVARYEDVRDVGAHNLEDVDLISGGFPCQPVSQAGKRRAQEDDRWLWPEFARVVRECEPALVVVENVRGLRTRGLRHVLSDLAELGFDAEWSHLAAGEIGSPHIRSRLFVVASHPDRIQLRNEPGWLCRSFDAACTPVPRDALAAVVPADSDSMRRLEQARSLAEKRGWSEHCGWRLGSLAGVDDGVPRAVDARRALGNAVVPQVAEWIGARILEALEPTEGGA